LWVGQAGGAERKTLSAQFDHVVMLTQCKLNTQNTTISNTDNRQFTTLVKNTSMAAPISLPPKMAKFATLPTDCYGALMLPCPMAAVIQFLCGPLLVG
jgi:hypothetical protein